MLAVALAGGVIGGVSYYAIKTYLSGDPCARWDWTEAALWGGAGAVLGAATGAVIYGGWWLGVQFGWWGGISSAPAIDFLESQTPRVQHIMEDKHAWGLIEKNLTGNLLEDYRTIQLYIKQAMLTTGTQISTSKLGPVIQFISVINGQQILVRAIKLADNTFIISDAWILTR